MKTLFKNCELLCSIASTIQKEVMSANKYAVIIWISTVTNIGWITVLFKTCDICLQFMVHVVYPLLSETMFSDQSNLLVEKIILIKIHPQQNEDGLT